MCEKLENGMYQCHVQDAAFADVLHELPRPFSKSELRSLLLVCIGGCLDIREARLFPVKAFMEACSYSADDTLVGCRLPLYTLGTC